MSIVEGAIWFDKTSVSLGVVLAPLCQSSRIVCHDTVQAVPKGILQFVKVNIFIGGPDHCCVAPCLHVAEQTWGTAMDAAEDANTAVDEATFPTPARKHSLQSLLLVMGHLSRH